MSDNVVAVLIVIVATISFYVGRRISQMLKFFNDEGELSVQVKTKAGHRTYFTTHYRVVEEGIQVRIYVNASRGYEWWPIEYFLEETALKEQIFKAEKIDKGGLE